MRRDHSIRIERTCAECGAAFIVGKRITQRLCSRACVRKAGTRATEKLHAEDFVPRFWSMVNKVGRTVRPELGPCWEWTGPLRNKWGYGRAYRQTRPLLAHRVSWELAHGEVPAGQLVLHKCDNPLCVNPAHLFIGDNADNMRDCASKGRNHVVRHNGEENPAAKITADQAKAIREMRRHTGLSYDKIGARFGLAGGTVRDIIKRETWRHTA
jgi:hypothetical protein